MTFCSKSVCLRETLTTGISTRHNFVVDICNVESHIQNLTFTLNISFDWVDSIMGHFAPVFYLITFSVSNS